jgi:hypothetical protein
VPCRATHSHCRASASECTAARVFEEAFFSAKKGVLPTVVLRTSVVELELEDFSKTNYVLSAAGFSESESVFSSR